MSWCRLIQIICSHNKTLKTHFELFRKSYENLNTRSKCYTQSNRQTYRKSHFLRCSLQTYLKENIFLQIIFPLFPFVIPFYAFPGYLCPVYWTLQHKTATFSAFSFQYKPENWFLVKILTWNIHIYMQFTPF